MASFRAINWTPLFEEANPDLRSVDDASNGIRLHCQRVDYLTTSIQQRVKDARQCKEQIFREAAAATRTMIYTTQIVRLDGLVLVASTDDANVPQLNDFKTQIRQVIKGIKADSEPRASIESEAYTMHYILNDNITAIAITERSYPKKLAMTYLDDVRTEFQSTHTRDEYLSPSIRPYAYADFERFLESSKKTYQDSRAAGNLNRLNDELKDVQLVMTKNIEDLLYRGDSLTKMGDMSSRLREDSAKYKRAAVRINWELLLKQYGPIAAFATIIVLFLTWRFFW
ncbi:SNAP receptor [Oleoguttula sp. CCFEE 5521]